MKQVKTHATPPPPLGPSTFVPLLAQDPQGTQCECALYHVAHIGQQRVLSVQPLHACYAKSYTVDFVMASEWCSKTLSLLSHAVRLSATYMCSKTYSCCYAEFGVVGLLDMLRTRGKPVCDVTWTACWLLGLQPLCDY